ncbi:hypothetical protein GCM10010420_39810 [Streptomyces glaucosporus]|uniref:Uncharacterized protein n=1 Tax=Streptomyces glaucosporus TaxID=284044 RepID=A0ABP5VQT9_9ACTN
MEGSACHESVTITRTGAEAGVRDGTTRAPCSAPGQDDDSRLDALRATPPPTAWSWRCSPGPCPASTAPPAPASCCSHSSRRWRRPNGGTSGSRRWRGSTPRPARASTAADPRSSPPTCSTPCTAAARAGGESAEQIQPDLITPTGKRKGQNPSVASIHRALAGHAKREAYPEAVEAAHADFAALKARDVPAPRTADRPEPTRYLAVLQFEEGGPAVTGEWTDDAPALRTYRGWAGLYGSQDSVVIRLIDHHRHHVPDPPLRHRGPALHIA